MQRTEPLRTAGFQRTESCWLTKDGAHPFSVFVLTFRNQGEAEQGTATRKVMVVVGMPHNHAILTLIRHAETTGNLNRLLQGVTDSPLTVFGQAQVDALARAWKSTATSLEVNVSDRENNAALTRSTDAGDDRPAHQHSKLDLPPPTLIVCSPIGRARKTAEAIHQACWSSKYQEPSSSVVELNRTVTASSTTTFGANPTREDVVNAQIQANVHRSLPLIVDFGLAEKDFGFKESTRGGVHVAGFPKGKGAGETKAQFMSKVKQVGSEWLSIASSLASLAYESASASGSTIPHIVLVTHGMWISTFLSLHPPTLISQTSGQPSFLPFAANTGIFSLAVHPLPDAKGGAKYRTDLIKANDIRHLSNVKRQKGGIGRTAFDSKQRKLSSFFTRSRKSIPDTNRTELKPDANHDATQSHDVAPSRPPSSSSSMPQDLPASSLLSPSSPVRYLPSSSHDTKDGILESPPKKRKIDSPS